jgi:hypothetical protein
LVFWLPLTAADRVESLNIGFTVSQVTLPSSSVPVIMFWSSSPAATPIDGTDEVSIANGNEETDDPAAGSDGPAASALSSTAPVWSRID